MFTNDLDTIITESIIRIHFIFPIIANFVFIAILDFIFNTTTSFIFRIMNLLYDCNRKYLL